MKENSWWRQEINRKIKENEFNLSTITVLYQVQQNAECFSVSQGPALIHRPARVAGSQQNLIARRPKAATYKRGHSSSHGNGNGLQPWSLITPLLQRYKVIREPSDKHQRSHTCEGGDGHEISDRYGRTGKGSRQEMEGRRGRVLSRRRKRNTRFIALSYGLCYSLTLQSGSEEFMWMWRRAALKGVTKEMAQGRWESTREGGRGGKEEESQGTWEEGKSICFSEERGLVKSYSSCVLTALTSPFSLCVPL